jgi:chromosome segregation ATPase
MVKQSRATIEDQSAEISSLRRQVELLTDTCAHIEGEHQRSKVAIDAELERNRALKKKHKKVKKSLGNEVASMSEESAQLSSRKDALSRELAEASDTIERLKLSMDDLREKGLRVDLSINQAVNEKLRLELELKKYRKLGKQPKTTPSQAPTKPTISTTTQ